MRKIKIIFVLVLVSLCFVLVINVNASGGQVPLSNTRVCPVAPATATVPAANAEATTTSGQTAAAAPTTKTSTSQQAQQTLTIGNTQFVLTETAQSQGYKISNGNVVDSQGKVVSSQLAANLLQQSQSTTTETPTAAITPVQAVTTNSPTTPSVQTVTTAPPVVSIGTTTGIATIPLDTNGDGKGDINFPNPGNIFTDNKITNLHDGVVTTESGNYFKAIPGGIQEVKYVNNKWVPVQGSKIIESNGVVIDTTTTTINSKGGATIKGATEELQNSLLLPEGSINPYIASHLSVDKNGELTLNGIVVSKISEDYVEAVNEKGEVNSIIVIGENNFVNTNGNVIMYDKNGAPLPNVPTLKDAKCDANGCTGKTGILGEDIKVEFTENGAIFKTDNGNVISREVTKEGVIVYDSGGPSEIRYFNGDYGTYQNHDTTLLRRYNSDGQLVQYGTGQDILTIFPTTDNQGNKITKWKDKDGNIIDESSLPDAAKTAVYWNNFWGGRTGYAKIGSTLQEADTIYNNFRFTNLFIDKWEFGGSKWIKDVDTVYAKYLGIEQPITSYYCDRWIANTDAPSTFAFGRGGIASAHIEGERSEYIDVNTSEKIYFYKITFSVTPSGALRDSDKILKFKVYYEPGEIPLKITQGVDGSNSVNLLGNSSEYRIDGTNMIVRQSHTSHDTVCLDFTGSKDDLDRTFASNLDKDYRLCNLLKPSNEKLPSDNYLGVADIITGRWSGKSKGNSNDDNTKDRTTDEHTPSAANTGQLED